MRQLGVVCAALLLGGCATTRTVALAIRARCFVARSEAHDSGLCRADAATKRAFSRDLLNLTLASPRVNRNQKSAKDAAEWQPAANQCWFAQTVVRRAYQLTIDRREADALDGILAGCSSTEMMNFM